MRNIEEKMKAANRAFKWRVATIVLFSVTLIAGCVLGLIFALRPTKSDLEKRDLTKFPTFTFASFMDGTYTSEISTWYADTYPFREPLLIAENSIKTAYGIQTDSIKAQGDGDDIPDIPSFPTEESSSEVASKETEETQETKTAETETAETETPSETETPAETTTEAPSTESTEATTAFADNGEEIAHMNPQEAGSVNIYNLTGYCVYGFNLAAADKYAEDVASVATALTDFATTYEIMVPDNSAITLPEEKQQEWNISDESKVIQYYNGKTLSLASNVKCVSIMDTLLAHNSEYLYFKTDHHWTQLGAYYAYTEFAKAAGFEAHDVSEYEQIVMENFLGSYYSSSGFTQLQDNPDTIVAYIPLTTNEMDFMDDSIQQIRHGKIVRDLGGDEFSPSVRYSCFIYGDCSFDRIENPNCQNGKTCIVVKESFGNCFVPFLADHYEKVLVVDYRAYTESIVQLAKEEGTAGNTDIVFINNLEAISDLHTMEVLGNICK